MDGAWLRDVHGFGWGRPAAARLLLWWCLQPWARGADLAYNVTLTGVGADYPLNFSAAWSVSVGSHALVVASGGCAAGTYCPAGSAAPLLCPAGYWCGALAGAGAACDATYTSAPGGASAADCAWLVRNVSVAGVGVGWALNFSAAWNVSVGSDALVVASGGCAAGAYCPAGAAAGLVCPAGYYCGAPAGAPAACAAGFTSPPGGASPADCALRWFNVTLLGVAANATLNWTAGLPPGWAEAAGADALGVGVAACPAGRWCPAGCAEPVVCAQGSYSGATGLSTAAAACGAACGAGSYCPDPGLRYPCPPHTASPPGSVSQLGCA